MRFRRWPRPTPYEDTPRKRAAFARKQRLEREALPLYASEIAENQHSADEEMERRAVTWDRVEQSKRDYHALKWREARARLFSFPEPVRLQIRRIWRACPYPPDHAYFSDLLRQIQIGKEDPYRPSWVFHPSIQARTTPNPATFAQGFKQIGKPTPSPNAPNPPTIYCGNLGSGILFLRATPPRIEHSEASPEPIAPSPCGECVDLEITGACSDDELALIQRLAQTDCPRPLIARRRGAEICNASKHREAA
jgi:hypothetical protein